MGLKLEEASSFEALGGNLIQALKTAIRFFGQRFSLKFGPTRQFVLEHVRLLVNFPPDTSSGQNFLGKSSEQRRGTLLKLLVCEQDCGAQSEQ